VRRSARFLVLVPVLSLAACSGADSGEPTGEVSEATTVCPKMVVEGIDVYDGQGAIDWAKVKADGRDFALMKATQGDYNTQTTFAANWSGSKAAGVLRSPYHFFDPTIDGVKQAQHFLATVSAHGGLEAGDLPPMLDIECPTSSNQAQASPNCEYNGNSGWVPTATLSQRVFDWLDTVEKATGRKPLVYSYPSWFAGVGFTDAKLAQYPLFIATLSSCADVPAPWTTTVFWQYSFTGTVTGIGGQVDLDRFVGDTSQLVAFANGPGMDGGADGGKGDGGGSGDAGTGVDSGGTGGDGGGVQPDGSSEADAGFAMGTGGSSNGGGCGCRIDAGSDDSPGWLVVLGAAIGAVGWSRRASRRRSASPHWPAAKQR
jgi:MYXO-CTERM domain-containing protein